MIAVIDADDLLFLSADRFYQLFIIHFYIIISTPFSHVPRHKLPAQLLIFPQNILIYIIFMAKWMGTYPVKQFRFHVPQFPISIF